MSIKFQQDIISLDKRVSELERKIEEALALLRAMARANTPKGKAA